MCTQSFGQSTEFMTHLNRKYWNDIYEVSNQPGWDAGEITAPLKTYIDQLTNKDLKILVPGAGNAHEVAYLFRKGYTNVYLCDFAELPIKRFKQRYPDFPEHQILEQDFFHLNDQFDLIIEQTFFTAIAPADRQKYVKQMYDLLLPKGKLVGLLFNHEFNSIHPPYGAFPEEYEKLFTPFFHLQVFQVAYNSIKPRNGRELFVNLLKK